MKSRESCVQLSDDQMGCVVGISTVCKDDPDVQAAMSVVEHGWW